MSQPTDGGQTGNGGVVVAGMVIRNELAYPVSDVMIDVPATGAFAGCGNLLAGSECSTTFQQIEYQGNALVVSWKEHGQPQQTDEFVVRAPGTTGPGGSFLLEVIVFAPGQAGARLVKADPEMVRNR